MTRYLLPALAVAVALAGQGCNTLAGQPEFIEAGISPSALKPGDEALITVKLKDKQTVVSGIEGVVQEDQRITFDLNDRGEQADAEAGDGVWTFGVKVPFQAPEGQFLLDLTAYRSDGNPVPIRDKEGNVAALSSTVPLIISVSAEAPAPEAPAPEGPEVSDRVKEKQKEYEPEPGKMEAPAPVEEEAPAVEEPVVEESAVEEPAAEEPVAEEKKSRKERKAEREAAKQQEEAQQEEAPVVEEVEEEAAPAEEEPKRSAKSIMGNRSNEAAEEEAPAEEETAPAEEAAPAVEEAEPVDGAGTAE